MSNSNNGGDNTSTGTGTALTPEPFQIQEVITVPERDLQPQEIEKIMYQIGRVCNFLGSMIMRGAALSTDSRSLGAGHPVAQNIINCAVQADAARMQLAGPRQVVPAQGPTPVPVPAMRRH